VTCRRCARTSADRSAARAAVLFSGGVDCSLLVCLIHRVLPPGEPIDLINVAFAQPKVAPRKGAAATPVGGGYDVPDRISGRTAVAELRAAFDREFRFVEVDVDVAVSLLRSG
jgi:asparagine synthetase B (glutamine-hydrolysing)